MSEQDRRCRVSLIFGGVSSEHEISCLTAGGVARALDSERFEVVGIGITADGRWVRVPLEQVTALDVVDGNLPRVPEGLAEAVLLRSAHGAQVATRIGDTLSDPVDIDVAFALLHGPYGEDGTIQGMFEMLGVRYVGAGVAASAIGMDKDLMKRSMASAGLPVGPWVAISAQRWQSDRTGCADAVAELGYPVFVKPARGGSSLGISRVDAPEDLAAAVGEARKYDPKVVVERGFVGCREIEVAVLQGVGGGAPRVSLPGEIIMHGTTFYDFDAKYLPEGQVSLRAPAALAPEQLTRVQALAGSTFEVMNCEGLARVDLFLTGEGEVFVNELNTMPGFTRHSMFPRLWQASGLTYSDLISELLELALNRPMGLR